MTLRLTDMANILLHSLRSPRTGSPLPGRRAAVLLRLFQRLLFCACLVAGMAHAQFSYPREQTDLDITITAAADVNPDGQGRAAPILVRLYELKSDSIFENADYFSLQSGDKSVLGSDLLVRDEFILRPGDVKTIRRKSHPEIAGIGVLAGYRDLSHADWRAVQKVAPAPEVAWYRAVLPANKLKLQIQLQNQGIKLTALK